MKKAICMMSILLMTGLLAGCQKVEIKPNTEVNYTPTAEPTGGDNSENNNTENNAEGNAEQKDTVEPKKEIELKEIAEIDFTYDYTEDIKADVNYVVTESSSLQEELKNMEKIIGKYMVLAESALTQGEMNVASQWLYVIWDTELNNLWSRFSDLADADTKEKILKEQRNWIAMKEEVTLLSLGSYEENGSMYPLLVNSLWEEKTRIERISLQMSWQRLRENPLLCRKHRQSTVCL